MMLNRPRLIQLLLLNIILISSVSAQSGFDLYFQGKLADIQGKEISNEAFDLAVQISRESDYTILYEIKTSASTDEQGWFGFTIPNMSQFLIEGGELALPVEIKMEILPNEQTNWMREGEGFMVSYTLSPFNDSTGNQLIMKRMEGSSLISHTEDHLYAFKDMDPFAYLLGGFLLSDHPPYRDQSLIDLQQWLLPESEDDGGVSRGVKGGFPTGGYYKKK